MGCNGVDEALDHPWCGVGWALPQGKLWLDSSGAVRCRGRSSWESFELQAAGGMRSVSRSLFFILLKGWAWRVKLMLIVLDVVVRDWDLPVIMTNPLFMFIRSESESSDSSLIWQTKTSLQLKTKISQSQKKEGRGKSVKTVSYSVSRINNIK